MKRIKTSKGEFLFVPVPDSAVEFYVTHTKYDGFKIRHKNKWGGISDYLVSQSPCQFIATTTDITEDEAAQIVGDNGMGCWDNYRLQNDNIYTCTSALQSLNCLMETSSLIGRYAILKLL